MDPTPPEHDMPPADTLRAFSSRAPLAWRGKPIKRIAPDDAETTLSSCERHFGTMEAAYRRSGGVASDAQVVRMLRQCSDQPLARLARWIAARDVVSFEFRATTWLPLFQFDSATPSVLPAVTAVIQELTDVFDDWELAVWFARPNAWLRERTPVEVLAACPNAVREAARADRFIARG
jgi:hypothetical protein